MKTMCPHSYYHNGFVATHTLEHMMYGLYIAHLASVSFEHAVCRGSLMTTYTRKIPYLDTFHVVLINCKHVIAHVGLDKKTD